MGSLSFARVDFGSFIVESALFWTAASLLPLNFSFLYLSLLIPFLQSDYARLSALRGVREFGVERWENEIVERKGRKRASFAGALLFHSRSRFLAAAPV